MELELPPIQRSVVGVEYDVIAHARRHDELESLPLDGGVLSLDGVHGVGSVRQNRRGDDELNAGQLRCRVSEALRHIARDVACATRLVAVESPPVGVYLLAVFSFTLNITLETVFEFRFLLTRFATQYVTDPLCAGFPACGLVTEQLAWAKRVTQIMRSREFMAWRRPIRSSSSGWRPGKLIGCAQQQRKNARSEPDARHRRLIP